MAAKENYAPRGPDGEWHPLFCEALSNITRLEYLIDLIFDGTLEERVEFATHGREEVDRIERQLGEYSAGTEGRIGEGVDIKF